MSCLFYIEVDVGGTYKENIINASDARWVQQLTNFIISS